MNWAVLSDEETWKFINTFAPWLSALGTISAVITSLYLATESRRIHLKVNAGLRTLVQQGFQPRDYVAIMVVNRVHRTATIQSVGWKIGFFRKKQFIQMPGEPLISSKLPQKLEDGESANYFFLVTPERGAPGWQDQFAKELDKTTFPKLAAYSMKAQVHTSVGKTFGARIDRSLRQQLIKNLAVKK